MGRSGRLLRPEIDDSSPALVDVFHHRRRCKLIGGRSVPCLRPDSGGLREAARGLVGPCNRIEVVRVGQPSPAWSRTTNRRAPPPARDAGNHRSLSNEPVAKLPAAAPPIPVKPAKGRENAIPPSNTPHALESRAATTGPRVAALRQRPQPNAVEVRALARGAVSAWRGSNILLLRAE
jgi:hypothetical protein